MNPDPLSSSPPERAAPARDSFGLLLLLGAWFGLAGGFLDLGMIFLKRDVFHATLYYEQGRHFRWVVPLANLAVIMPLAVALAGLHRLFPDRLTYRRFVWILATFAVWGPCLRAPLFGLATLLLAAGFARWASGWIGRRGAGFTRFAAVTLPIMVIVVGAVAADSIRRHRVRESEALASLPAAPQQARNVLLIVLDTVRARSLSLYGYDRDTTPRLREWARRGVLFERAYATAPWTFPSHCSMMTGQWPSTLGAHWRPTTDPAHPMLAEFLAQRGYSTAGFAANTHWCSYESGMDRGFAHYEDYPLSVATFLRGTMPGRWVLERIVHRGDPYEAKWVRSQSRDAAEINAAFLDWLSRRPAGRSFFAFLNYLDAHEPFVPPPGRKASFGLRPETAAESRMLLEYWDLDKLQLSPRDVELARDSYDDCIAALDEQVGALLDALDRSGVLRETLVILTSDHGEQFGEHGVFNHGFSLYGNEIHVPLLILSPDASKGTRVAAPVSLRELPATAVQELGLAASGPFPGWSLGRFWRSGSGPDPPQAHPVLSEVDIPMVITSHRGRGPNQRGFTVSLVGEGLHYLLDMRGVEELYELEGDPDEVRNFKDDGREAPALNSLRVRLGDVLRAAPSLPPPAAGYVQQLLRVLGSVSVGPKL